MFDVLESIAACCTSALMVDIHGVRILSRMIFLTTSDAAFWQLKLAPFDLLQLFQTFPGTADIIILELLTLSWNIWFFTWI